MRSSFLAVTFLFCFGLLFQNGSLQANDQHPSRRRRASSAIDRLPSGHSEDIDRSSAPGHCEPPLRGYEDTADPDGSSRFESYESDSDGGRGYDGL